MKNERKTEALVRKALVVNGYEADASIRIEEQKSEIAQIQKALKSASKSGKGGGGAPEFIITSSDDNDYVLLIECKANVADHESAWISHIVSGTEIDETPEARVKRIQRYGVDGGLHYAAALAKQFNVIVLAVSGSTASSLEISAFVHPKGADKPVVLHTKEGKSVDAVIPWRDLVDHARFDPSVQKLRFDELMAFSRELHDFMRSHAKLTESEKPLLVSGTLIALRNAPFALSYDAYAPNELQREWLKVIETEIEKAAIPQAKKQNMSQPYSGIAVHPELGKATKAYPKGVLNELISRLNEKVWPFISVYHDFDIVGQFYGEFLKYTGGDKKALGIVLTPRHITELFAHLANVGKNSKVLDICAGTGGFLISSMHQMMRHASSEDERELIKKEGLIGVEQQPNMFALAASNMILRGDGKANLYQGDCFDKDVARLVSKHKCDVGMINPPFSQDDADLHELYFIKQMLDLLQKGGIGLAIAPMSCAISPHPAKAELLKHHTLEAVMSLPHELFYPVGTVTCAMVFTAHVAHATSDRKTWFGYWKDDGFRKTKQWGRIDRDKEWPAIRQRWVDTFRNREVHPGESVARRVGAGDEWCAEAYMETDYSNLSMDDFEDVVRRYAVFKLVGAQARQLDEDGDEATV
jgi:16S rRNA G966 N2-methylase RsmD